MSVTNQKKENNMRIAIWDIDNCLADDRHRHHLIDWDKQGDERYRRYNREMLQDEPVHVAEFNVMRKIGCTPVFFTGRPEVFRVETTQWIREKLGVTFPVVEMRPNGTLGLTPADLKETMLRKWLREAPGTRQGWVQLIAAFDDLPEVVEMYRSYGIPAVQLAAGDPYAAYGKEDRVGVSE